MTVWQKIQRITWFFIAIVATIAVVSLFFPMLTKYRKMQSNRTGMQQELAAGEVRLRYYQEQEKRFPSDSNFVEQIARKAGMIKTNEAVFKVVGAGSTTQATPVRVSP